MPNPYLTRPAAILAAGATAATAWAITTHALGVQLLVHIPHSTPSTVGLAATVGTAAAVTALGCGALSAIDTFASRPRRTWLIVSLAVVAASLIPAAAFASTAATAISLVAMHLAVAAVAVTSLAGTARPRQPERTADRHRRLPQTVA